MSTVLRFPIERVRGALYPAYRSMSADILILPVVQVEREESPDNSQAEGGAEMTTSGAGNGTNGRNPRSPGT